MFDLISEINRNFIITKINTIRFILTLPLLLIGIRRFFKQIPLEDHYNNKKALPSFFFDYFSKFIFLLFFILEGALLFTQNKNAEFGLAFYLNNTNYFLLGLLILILLVIDYHPWFLILRMIMFIFLQIAPRDFNIIVFNLIFILLCEIGLRQKPWVEKISYNLFSYISMLTVVLCFMKSRKLLF